MPPQLPLSKGITTPRTGQPETRQSPRRFDPVSILGSARKEIGGGLAAAPVESCGGKCCLSAIRLRQAAGPRRCPAPQTAAHLLGKLSTSASSSLVFSTLSSFSRF